MSKIKKELEAFRLRGFMPADPEAERMIVWGSNPAPKNPDGSDMTCFFDQWHEHHIMIAPYAGQDLPKVDAGTVADPGVPASEPSSDPV